MGAKIFFISLAAAVVSVAFTIYYGNHFVISRLGDIIVPLLCATTSGILTLMSCRRDKTITNRKQKITLFAKGAVLAFCLYVIILAIDFHIMLHRAFS